MTHVVLESCIRCKYTDCVDVCPVDCFREGPNFLTIDPDECIDCAVCIPECPVNAIVPEEDVPGDQQHMIPAQRRARQGLAEHHPAQGGAAGRGRVERPHRQARPADPLTAPPIRWLRPVAASLTALPVPASPATDRDRCADRRRRPGGAVRGVRARPARGAAPRSSTRCLSSAASASSSMPTSRSTTSPPCPSPPAPS